MASSDNANIRIINTNGVTTSEDISLEVKQDAIKLLRNKIIQDIKVIKNINTDDDYLLRWLNSTDFDIETSFIRMRDFHINMVEYPHWYQKESPLNRKSFFDDNAATMLPSCDKEGRPIYIAKIGNLDPDKTTFADEACIDDIWFEYILNKDPEVAKKGLCLILDVGGVSWKYVKMLTFKDVKMSFKKIASLPFKEFKLHLVNNSKYVNTLMRIVQPFIPEDSKKQLILHFNGWESLHNYVDRDSLPPEYGGYLKIDYKYINENLFKQTDLITKNFNLHRSVCKS